MSSADTRTPHNLPLATSPLSFRLLYQRVAVLGDGVMGSQIAIHLANCGVPVILYCTISVEKEERTAYCAALKKRMAKLKPAALATTATLDRIKIAFLDELEEDARAKEEFATCTLLIEAIIEQIDAKKSLYQTIAPSVNPDAIIASNTSGLSINDLAAVLPKTFATRFCGIHFFNPVRYLPLCELIPLPSVPVKQQENLSGFLTSVLGKRVVISKDSPAFIGNRLGLFCVLTTFALAEKYKLPPDLIDELTGTLILHSNSATFRTADIVGLDVLAFVASNMESNLTDDPWHSYFSLPAWINALIADKKLGTKTKQGVFHKRGKEIYVFDPSLDDYRPRKTAIDPELKKHIRNKGIAKALLSLQTMQHPQAQFLWDLHRELFLYASHHLDSYGSSVRDADSALTAGFGWKIGVFELWQEAGIQGVNQSIVADCKNKKALTEAALPKWVEADQPFYTPQGALTTAGTRIRLPQEGIAVRQQRSAPIIKEQGNPDRVFFENEGIIAHEISDSVVALSHKTKLNVLSHSVIEGYHAVLDALEKRGGALVIHQLSPHFGAGANLAEILVAAKTGKIRKAGMVSALASKAVKMMDSRLPDVSGLPPISKVIPQLQELCMRLKHGPNPVVTCVEGLALGGCCEVLLHSDHTVASLNSFIGLVEIGVGLIPAGAGTKEMAYRASKRRGDAPTMAFHIQYLEQILKATVCESAPAAQQCGYLRSDDTIIANPDELFYTGRKVAESLLDRDYRPPSRQELFSVAGTSGYATVMSQLENMHYGKFISDHDALVASTIAKVFCGGGVDDNQLVTSDFLIKQECEAFLTLLETEKTQARIEHMLKHNKPLRN